MKNKTLYSIDEILPKPSRKHCSRRRSSFRSNSSLQSLECYFESSSIFCKCKSWKEATIIFDLNVFSVMINNKPSISIHNSQLLCVNIVHQKQKQSLYVVTAHVNLKVIPNQKAEIAKLRIMCRNKVEYCLIFERLRAISLLNNNKLHNEANMLEFKYNTLPRIINGYLILSKIVRAKCFDIFSLELQSFGCSNNNSFDIRAVINSEITTSSRNLESDVRITKAIAESSVSSLENLKSSECDEWGNKETYFKTKVSSSLYRRFTTFFSKISS